MIIIYVFGEHNNTVYIPALLLNGAICEVDNVLATLRNIDGKKDNTAVWNAQSLFEGNSGYAYSCCLFECDTSA